MKGPRSVLAAVLGGVAALASAFVALALLAIAQTGSWFDGPVERGPIALHAAWLLVGAGLGGYGAVRAWQGRWRHASRFLALAAVPTLTYWPNTYPLLVSAVFIGAAVAAYFRLRPVVLVASDEEE